tara:strand:+ start:160 stop:726 length:567 start_codon:yes stop_codon:yes gene_type:complete
MKEKKISLTLGKEIVEKLLGWASLGFTLKLYLHPRDRDSINRTKHFPKQLQEVSHAYIYVQSTLANLSWEEKTEETYAFTSVTGVHSFFKQYWNQLPGDHHDKNHTNYQVVKKGTKEFSDGYRPNIEYQAIITGFFNDREFYDEFFAGKHSKTIVSAILKDDNSIKWAVLAQWKEPVTIPNNIIKETK